MSTGRDTSSRYRRLLAIFWGNAISTQLEYRLNFWATGALSLFWVVWASAGIGVYFRFTDTIAGWSYPELVVVIGLFYTLNGVRQALIQPNLAKMTEYIRLGTLDFLLTKPVNAQFLVSFRHLGIYNCLDPVLGLGLALAGLIAADRPVRLSALLSFGLLLASALVLLYGLSLLLISASVWAVDSEGIDDLLQGAVETGRFPVQLYRGIVQALLTVAVPVAFLTTFPAEALLGRVAPAILLIAPLMATASVLAGSFMWRMALRSYTGASA